MRLCLGRAWVPWLLVLAFLARLGYGFLDPPRPSAGAALADPDSYAAGRAVLTLRGRLLADGVVRDLLT